MRLSNLNSGKRPVVSRNAANGTSVAGHLEDDCRCRRCGATHGLLGRPFTERTLRIHEGTCAKGDSPYGLSLREQQMAQFIIAGLSTLQIAQRFKLRPPTVNYYVNKLKSKLGVKKRAEVIDLMANGHFNGVPSRTLLKVKPHRELGIAGEPVQRVERCCPQCGHQFTFLNVG